MITATATNNSNQKIDYPMLMESPKTGNIVLFSSHEKGMVIFSTGGVHKMGYYSDTWGMSCFRPYYGTVVLNTGGES